MLYTHLRARAHRMAPGWRIHVRTLGALVRCCGYDAQTPPRPVLNMTSFPNITAMTAYGHAHNLTLGWYTNNIGCAGQEAGWSATPELHERHYAGVADFLAATGFDEMKVDSGGKFEDFDTW